MYMFFCIQNVQYLQFLPITPLEFEVCEVSLDPSQALQQRTQWDLSLVAAGEQQGRQQGY